MSVTVVVTTLPGMLAEVGAAPADSTLVATSYAMFFGGLMMFGARLGDRVGHRRCILGSLAVFAAGTLLTATATSTLSLTTGRCVQGAAAAAAVPSALRLLTTVARGDRERARALALWSAAGAAAGGSGFLVGGVVSEVGSWRLVFWGLLVVAVVLAVAITALVPAGPRLADRAALNVAGSGLLTGTVMLVIVGSTLLGEAPHRLVGASLLAGAVLGLGLFVRTDRRSPAPLLPRDVVGRPQVRRGSAGAFFNTATTGGAATLLTLYLQDTLGRSPLAAAAALLPFSVLVVAGSAAAARLMPRTTSEQVAAGGLGLIGVGVAALSFAPSSMLLVGAAMAVAGLGIGLSSVATTSMATDVPEWQRATASGIVNTSAQLGSAIGTAVLLVVASATTGIPGREVPPPLAAWATAAVMAFGIAAALTKLRRGRQGRRM